MPAVLVGVAVAAVALTGCGGSPRPAAATPSATATPTTGGSTPSSAASASSQPASAPVDTPLGAGQRVWAAFNHRGISHDAWWAALRPMLSEAAQASYVYDDPRNLPTLVQTGRIHAAAKAPDDPHFTAEVIVPTGKGTFRLDLERRTRHSPWLLYAIRFPRGVG
ncbi:hypothetical protein GCM10027596_02580 [Nocardioides korecus]